MTVATGYLEKSIIFCALLMLAVSTASAQTLNQIQQEGEKKLVEAEQSQKRIDKIVEGAQERLIQYQALQKVSELGCLLFFGLLGYNFRHKYYDLDSVVKLL